MKLKPILLNQEYQDPVLMFPIPQKTEIVLFDIGYCFRLKVRDIQKISRIFVTHTHIDHFAGFDHILRLSLDKEKSLAIYGPPEIIKNVEGKLAGYTWNLLEVINLDYEVFEIHPDMILKKIFKGARGYKNPETPVEIPRNPDDPVCETEDYSVAAVFLEHKMPVLSYKISASDSYNADINKIRSLGLTPGKWVGNLKNRVASNNISSERVIEVEGNLYNEKVLANNIVKKTPGTVVAFVVDTIFNPMTAGILREFAHKADFLFCECTYLDSEKELAEQNHHLTARQAATIALEAEVKALIPFHFSRRYEGVYNKLTEEASSVFPKVEKPAKYGED